MLYHLQLYTSSAMVPVMLNTFPLVLLVCIVLYVNCMFSNKQECMAEGAIEKMGVLLVYWMMVVAYFPAPGIQKPVRVAVLPVVMFKAAVILYVPAGKYSMYGVSVPAV